MPPAISDHSSETRPTVSNTDAVSHRLSSKNRELLTVPSLEIARQAGNEPPLVGLLRVYKDYYPDVIVGDTVTGRAAVFTVGNNATDILV